MSDSTNADPLVTRDLPSSELASTHAHSAAQSGVSGSSSLQVRCPNCHSPTEIAVDTRLTDLTCSICGSHFSLVDQSQATRMAPSLSKMGRFELIERIGVGGFGSVWKARDKELDRTVAIKIPRAAGMTPEEQEKFFREARAAAQLRHPSIVSVHEVGRDGDSVYIVSDFVRGVTLGDWQTGQQLTNREAAELCAKIADALHHAHEQGVVHRDLKPANIMMDYDGQPHLMDFGLARRESGEITMTMDGQVLGTPAYMSPEQAQGEAHKADRRSDVYSIGVILFQLLTGELPFRGNARMLIKQVVQDEPPSPRKLNSNVSKDLETLTLKCLEKDPTRRYQSAAELADELRCVLAGKPIHARPVGRLERGWRWAKRNTMAAALWAALLLVLVTVSTVAPIIAARQSNLRGEAVKAESTARTEAQRATSEAERAAREADSSQRLANFVGAKYALSQDRLREAYQQITAAMSSEPSWEYGRILSDIANQSRRDWQLLTSLPAQDRPNWGCFVGAGPKWFVLSQGDTLSVHSLVRDATEAQANVAGGGKSPCPLGDDRMAVVSGGGKVTIFAVPSLDKVAECEMPGEIVFLRSHVHGKYFVGLNKDGLARVFDRDGKQRAEHKFKIATAELKLVPTIDISPSGKSVLFDTGMWTRPKYCWLWETDELKPIAIQAHTSRFADDDTVLTVWNSSSANENVLIQATKLSSKQTSTLYYGNGVFYSDEGQLAGMAPDLQVTRNKAAANEADAGADYIRIGGQALVNMPLVNAGGVNIFGGREGNNDIFYDNGATDAPIVNTNHFTRFSSIWPHSEDEPRFLACADGTLALAADHKILIFVRWVPSERDSSVDLACTFWTTTVAGDLMYAMSGVTLQVLDLHTFKRTRYPLALPENASYGIPTTALSIEEPSDAAVDKRLMPWGIAVAPKAGRLAVLWQEADHWGNVGSKCFRKLVAIYALPPAGSQQPPKMTGYFELKDYFGVAGRSNRGMWMSPDAKQLVFCSSTGKFSAYRTEDGEKLYAKDAGRQSGFVVDSKFGLLGVSNFSKADEFQAYDLATGEAICRIALDAPVVHACFAANGKSVYVGTSAKVTRQYDLSDGHLLSEVKTRVAPVAISPLGNRYLGFAPDTTTVGSLVLADLHNGHTLETINPSAHVVNEAFFDSEGKTFALVVARDRSRAMTSFDIKQTVASLERPSRDSRLASESTDLLAYRERMVQEVMVTGRKAAALGDRSAAREAFLRSATLLRSLHIEFPTSRKFTLMLADGYDGVAFVEDEVGRKRTVEQMAISLRKAAAALPDDTAPPR